MPDTFVTSRSIVPSQDGHHAARPRLSIGIVNNMPDAALQATERQFITLLETAAEGVDLRIQLFSLPGIARAEAARERVQASYLDTERLARFHMDALIVTGAGPKAASISQETYWPHLAELAEWARTNTLSTIWSCLAAHAAVHHLDGIDRRPLPRKLSGVFSVERCRSDALLDGLSSPFTMPQSRYNTLAESDLEKAGYAVLSRSDAVGPDIFSKMTPSLFLFFQGHPEYDDDTLLREYRRDLIQHAAGARGRPDMPAHYFSAEASAALGALPGHPDAIAAIEDAFRAVEHGGLPRGAWRDGATLLFRNWLRYLAAQKLLLRQPAGALA
jgi:homoserine O-succinyltransferase